MARRGHRTDAGTGAQRGGGGARHRVAARAEDGVGGAIIAATALAHGLALVTRNVDDFKHVAGLALINPFAEPESD